MIFFCIPGPDDQNRWNRKNCPKFFHRVIFAFWIQICNPNLCKSHIFWITANIEKWSFFLHTRTWWPKPDDQNRWNWKNCPKFFHRVIFAFFAIFAFWISATQIYVNPIHFEIQLILRNDLFLHTRTWWPKSEFPNLQPKFM